MSDNREISVKVKRKAPSSAFALSGVNGIERSRAPVASKIALPMAAGMQQRLLPVRQEPRVDAQAFF